MLNVNTLYLNILRNLYLKNKRVLWIQMLSTFASTFSTLILLLLIECVFTQLSLTKRYIYYPEVVDRDIGALIKKAYLKESELKQLKNCVEFHQGDFNDLLTEIDYRSLRMNLTLDQRKTIKKFLQQIYLQHYYTNCTTGDFALNFFLIKSLEQTYKLDTLRRWDRSVNLLNQGIPIALMAWVNGIVKVLVREVYTRDLILKIFVTGVMTLPHYLIAKGLKQINVLDSKYNLTFKLDEVNLASFSNFDFSIQTISKNFFWLSLFWIMLPYYSPKAYFRLWCNYLIYMNWITLQKYNQKLAPHNYMSQAIRQRFLTLMSLSFRGSNRYLRCLKRYKTTGNSDDLIYKNVPITSVQVIQNETNYAVVAISALLTNSSIVSSIINNQLSQSNDYQKIKGSYVAPSQAYARGLTPFTYSISYLSAQLTYRFLIKIPSYLLAKALGVPCYFVFHFLSPFLITTKWFTIYYCLRGESSEKITQRSYFNSFILYLLYYFLAPLSLELTTLLGPPSILKVKLGSKVLFTRKGSFTLANFIIQTGLSYLIYLTTQSIYPRSNYWGYVFYYM